MRTLLFSVLFLFIASLLVSCQTSRAISFAYHDATYGGDQYKQSDQTSVLFLVDGLSSEILRTALQTAIVPHLADAFTLSRKARFQLGRAVFPSLTFPNITSILTGRSDAKHPIIGNRIYIDGGLINFENVASWPDLARLIQRRTIFTRLSAESESSVSYAYAFSGGATAGQEKTIESGVGYLENDFASVDLATLDSLKKLLTETQVSKWPRFIFVHLIGIDATAHHNGPLDSSVQSYLHQLDRELGEVFSILDHPNGLERSSRHVSYALTADHGFKTTPDHSPLDEVVMRLHRKFRLLADNRVAPLFIDEPMTSEEKLALAGALLQVPHVGWAAVKTVDTIELFRRNGQHARISFAEPGCSDGQRAAHFEWLHTDTDDSSEYASRTPKVYTCLKQFDLSTGVDDDSYIVPAFVDYFANPGSPDMVFIPDDHSDFAAGYAGNHGGITREEMLVPVLTKDIDLPRGIQPTYELIRLMDLEK